MNIFRKLLFTILALAFCVLCPRLIVHTLGYLDAGLLVVESLPRDAEVYLNGTRIARRTPYTATDVAPGSYLLQLSKDGFQPLEMKVRIQKGEVTLRKALLLLPENPRREKLAEGPYDSLTPLTGTPYCILMNHGLLSGVQVFNTGSRTLMPLFPGASPEEKSTVLQIFTVPKSPFVVVKAQQNSQTVYFRVQVDKPSLKSEEISDLVPDNNTEILWAAEKPDLLYCFNRGTVDQVNLARNTVTEDFAKNWVGLGAGGDKVYGLDEDGRFLLKGFRGQTLDAENTELTFRHSLFGRIGFLRIRAMQDGSFLMHETDGLLLQSALPHVVEEEGIVGLAVSNHLSAALVWENRRLGVLGDIHQDPRGTIFVEGRTVQWMPESTDEISDAAFLYGESHALCVLGNQVKLFDLEELSLPPREVCTILPGTRFKYMESQGSLFALDPEDGHLSGIQLLPPQEIATGTPVAEGAK